MKFLNSLDANKETVTQKKNSFFIETRSQSIFRTNSKAEGGNWGHTDTLPLHSTTALQ